MTLRKQTLFLFITFSLIPVLIAIAGSLIINTNTIRNLHGDRLNTITKTSAAAFSEIVGMRKENLTLLASSWDMQDYLRSKENHGKDSKETNAAAEKIKRDFNTYINTFTTFDDLVFINEYGIVEIGHHSETVSLNLSSMDYFVRVSENYEENYVFCSKVHPSLTESDNKDLRYLALSKAIRDKDGKLQGVLVAFIDVTIIAEFSKSISFGRTGIAFVIDADNYILYHVEERFYNSYTAAPQLTNLLERYKQGVMEEYGLLNDVMDGKRRIYYYYIMPEIELVLILRQDYDEFTADTTVTVIFSVIICFFTFLLAIILGIKFSSNLMKPIRTLNKAFSSGQREGKYISCKLPLKNEFGNMADSYNKMIDVLETQYKMIKDEKEKNEYNVYHDYTTGLYNRRAFELELSQKVVENASFGVFYLDIDNFKRINYLFGHVIGDELLSEVGKRLEQSKALFEVCTRIGGDEFVFLKDGIYEDIIKAAEILLEEFRQPFILSGTHFYLTSSIGIALFPDYGSSGDNLIANADIAMYEIKESGKNMYRIFNYEMRYKSDRYSEITEILRYCIEKNELMFMYQPIFDIKSKKVAGFEVLMRIKSEKLGLISPIEFIKIAENDKIRMINIGKITLEESCKVVKELSDQINFNGFMAVNISIVQLEQPDFSELVLAIIEDTGIYANQLLLEIDEKIVTACNNDIAKKLNDLHHAGVQIAIDHFGRQNITFANFVDLPIDILKIDWKFVEQNDKEERTRFMNAAVFEYVKGYNMRVIIEEIGVKQAYSRLQELGCDMVQGFVYSKPVLKDHMIEAFDQKIE